MLCGLVHGAVKPVNTERVVTEILVITNCTAVTITVVVLAPGMRYANAIGRRCTSRLDSSDIIYRTLIRTIGRLLLVPAAPSSLTERCTARCIHGGQLCLPTQLPQSASVAVHHADFSARFHLLFSLFFFFFFAIILSYSYTAKSDDRKTLALSPAYSYFVSLYFNDGCVFPCRVFLTYSFIFSYIGRISKVPSF